MVPNMVTHNSLIDGLCKLGRISYVWDLIDEMHDRARTKFEEYTKFIIATNKGTYMYDNGSTRRRHDDDGGA